MSNTPQPHKLPHIDQRPYPLNQILYVTVQNGNETIKFTAYRARFGYNNDFTINRIVPKISLVGTTNLHPDKYIECSIPISMIREIELGDKIPEFHSPGKCDRVIFGDSTSQDTVIPIETIKDLLGRAGGSPRNLRTIYNHCTKCVYAIAEPAAKTVLRNGNIPVIYGTGFCVSSEGLLITNRHVVQEAEKANKNASPSFSILHFAISYGKSRAIAIEINDYCSFGGFNDEIKQKLHHKDWLPDLAAIKIQSTECPHLHLSSDYRDCSPGCKVATTGYPLGKSLLVSESIPQLSPTLQTGTISAATPCASETPYDLMVNIMAQGGASGSPVFLEDSIDVVGALRSRYHEIAPIETLSQEGRLIPKIGEYVRIPTNYSHAVPSCWIKYFIKSLPEAFHKKLPNTSSWESIIQAGV